MPFQLYKDFHLILSCFIVFLLVLGCTDASIELASNFCREKGVMEFEHSRQREYGQKEIEM